LVVFIFQLPAMNFLRRGFRGQGSGFSEERLGAGELGGFGEFFFLEAGD
jgi:hypothetical protein